MAASSTDTVVSDGVIDAPGELPVGDEHLLGQLAELWQTHQLDGLDKRHRMGSLVNQRLGPPTKRQPHGKQVLKLASDRLRISVSELSRMRQLAHRFPTVAALREQHPWVDSFTRFKELLSTLNPPMGKRNSTDLVMNQQNSVLRRVHKTLGRAILNLRRMEPFPTGRDRDNLMEKVRELNEVVKNGLRFNDLIA